MDHSNELHEEAHSKGLAATTDVNMTEAPVTWKAYLLCAFASFGGIFFGMFTVHVSSGWLRLLIHEQVMTPGTSTVCSTPLFLSRRSRALSARKVSTLRMVFALSAVTTLRLSCPSFLLVPSLVLSQLVTLPTSMAASGQSSPVASSTSLVGIPKVDTPMRTDR
jgi:hypothetical protein